MPQNIFGHHWSAAGSIDSGSVAGKQNSVNVDRYIQKVINRTQEWQAETAIFTLGII